MGTTTKKPRRYYTTLPFKIIQEIITMRDKSGLTFREIGRRLNIEHTTVYRTYEKHMKGVITVDKVGDKSDPALCLAVVKPERISEEMASTREETKVSVEPTGSVDVIENTESKEISEAREINLVPVDDKERQICSPLVKPGVLLDDNDMADKLNLLIPRLLGLTVGEFELVIADMPGSQRIEAASKLIDKMRLLRNQSTENVNTNTFVNIISKLTASMRKKKEK